MSATFAEKRAALERLLRERARESMSRHRLSHGQRMMWFLHQLAPDSTAYHLGQAVKLSGTLELSALRRALELLVRRHPMLRTTFASGGAEPEQRVHAVGDCQLHTEDASTWEPARLDARLLERIEAPYDLERGPLLRVDVFRRAEDEHVLLLAMHHIVGEFWALLVLVLELTELYQAERQHRPALLPALTRRYTDFAEWQRTWLDGPEAQAHARYWEEQLTPLPRPVDLPGAHPRPPVQTYEGATHPFTLEPELTRRLREFARAEGATLYTVLLALFAAQVSRYTRSEELLIGTPFTGRTSAAWSQVIGYFDNPLPLRADLSGDPSPRELVARLRRTVLDAFAHQAVPFPLIVERLQPRRDASRPPLFNLMLVLRKSHLPRLQPLTAFSMGSASARLQWGELTVEPCPLARHVASMDLSLVLAESGDELLAYWEYNTCLFDADTLERFTGHLKVLMDEALRAPERRLSTLPLLTRPEEEQVRRWNDTSPAPPPRGCLHRPFEQRARLHPEAPALIAQGRTWSYGELDTQAEQVAGWLRSQGAQRERLVGIVMEKGWEQVVAVLGTLKSGAAYLPIDAHLPTERIHHLLEVSRVSLVLTQPGCDTRLSWPEHVRRWELTPDTLASLEARREESAQEPDDLAYVLFTSGSTGSPKGVMIEHAAALNTVLDMNERFQVGPGDRVFGLSSLSFDLSVQDIFGTLAAGATLVLPEARGAQDPSHWVDCVREERVTIWNSVPGLARLLVGHAEQRAPDALRSLRMAWLSGDWIPLQLPGQLRRLAPGLSVIGLGGATEASIWSILYPVERVEPGWKSIPYGRPMTHQTMHVLDAGLHPCPVGVVGELYIGGVGVARGYWADPTRTAERFITHPSTGERLYRTGDLGRRDREGIIEFLGRMDTQVKIRGFRVEPGEVEHALTQHPCVERALVVARRDAEGEDPRLVAYVVPRAEARPTPSELHQTLKDRLPDYLMPSRFVVLSTLPLTSNGKVDLAALPTPERTRPPLPVCFRPPETEAERQLAVLWARVLGLDEVGVEDNFFELGGDSVQAIQVCLRAQEEGWVLGPRQLFERPTISELARALEPRTSQARSPAAPPRVKEGETCPLSPMQHTMFLHGLCAPDRAAYSVQVFCPLSGPLEPARLERAWEQVLARHPNLRARFLLPEGGRHPVQVFESEREVPWHWLDWREQKAEAQEASLRAWTREERARGFLPTDGALLRPTLIRLGDERWMLVLSHHHLLLDGWSLSPLLEDLWRAYEALERGALPRYGEALPFSEHLRALEERDLGATERFWKEELAGLGEPRPLCLPTPEGGAPRGFEHAEWEWALGEQETARLVERARAAGLTLNTLVQGAWALVLARDGDEEEVVMGVTVSGRPTDTPGAGGAVGLYIETLPLRVRVEDTPPTRAWLGGLQRRQPTLQEHGGLSIAAIQRASGLEDRQRPFGLYESVLVFENYPLDPWLRSPERTVRTGEPRFSEQTNTPLTLYAFPGRRLAFRLSYDASRFAPSAIAMLARHLGLALEALAGGMDRPLGELSVLGDEERHLLLDTWSQARETLPEAPLVPALIEQQARRTPHHPAVEGIAETLTYAELLQRARDLAARLVRRGVGLEVPVALCLEREPGLIVSMLGTWKAGGVYLPLDPTAPRERLAALLADSGASLVVTRRALADRLPGSVRLLCLDEEGDDSLPPDEGTLEREAAAYIIYTSGSTGRSKGTVVSHEALAAFVASARALYGLGTSDRILQFASPAFDASVEEIFPGLASGATLVLRDEEMARSVPTFVEFCERTRLTVLDLPTAFWHELEAQRAVLPESTRWVILGGEAVRAERVHGWKTRRTNPPLMNTYGPTEATVVATACDLSRPGEASHRAAIGQPLPHVEAHVLDARLRPVPVGVAGELYLGGVALARGYLHQPALTAERFLPDPFSRRPGARLYRTGDRVRLLTSGDLEFLGRRDAQVKIRGFRVEPGELEAVLLSHPDVAEAAVVPLRDEHGGWRLAAFVVARGEQRALSALRQHLEHTLPHYLHPTFLEWREQLPRNTSGKVARHLLRPERDARPAAVPLPSDALEARLLGHWREVLDQPGLGVHDNFFEAGGDSIRCLQLVARMNQEGLALGPRHLFQHQSVAELARVLRAQSPEAPARDREDSQLDPSIVPRARERPGAEGHLLLTGATGFLGTFLLAELLTRTRATVHCLVRAPDADGARARLHRALVEKGLWEESWSARIEPVVGDLSEPRLGLTERDFDTLAGRLEGILHNGATVNMALPYARLRAANVQGTGEVLRLASQGGGVPVHFVSTLAVFDGQPSGEDGHLEDTRPALESLPAMGYARSKGVAESWVFTARERGLPASIYRPATIIGHARSGASPEADVLTLLVKACIEAGCIPGVDHLLHLVPVSYVSAALVELAVRQGLTGGSFHLTPSRPTPLRELTGWLRSFGFALTELPYARWYEVMRERASRTPEAPLGALLSLLPERWTEPPRQERYDQRRTREQLADTGVREGVVDEVLFHRQLEWLCRQGVLPRPGLAPEPGWLEVDGGAAGAHEGRLGLLVERQVDVELAANAQADGVRDEELDADVGPQAEEVRVPLRLEDVQVAQVRAHIGADGLLEEEVAQAQGRREADHPPVADGIVREGQLGE